MVEVAAAPKRNRFATLIAGIVTGAVVAGSLVAVGVGANQAAAAEWAPTVEVQSTGTGGKGFILAGEDASFRVNVSNPANGGGGKQFNLGVSALLPLSVSYVSGTAAPTKIYRALEEVPNETRTAPATAESCAASGLIPASTLTPPGKANRCAVPEGQQLWVWSNINDLPEGGTVPLDVTVRPDAGTYPVGSTINLAATAYTSNDPSRLPTFDGSTSKAVAATHTSKPGTDAGFTQPDVRAIRVSKSEPSPEDELLRGVHSHPTVYTIKIENTGQAPTEDVTVVDYLPAGLEFLGTAGGDNSAPGTGEYLVDGQPMRMGAQPQLASPEASRVETVQLGAAEAAQLGLAGAGVYTKVTWVLGALSGGSAQVLPTAAATAGVSELKYYAAVPLFENALWQGTAPATESGLQGANLDNNTGPSTRHGSESASAPANAQALVNAATASGAFTGPVLDDDDALRTTSDSDTESVDSVDLHVIKSVQEDAFKTGALAEYTLNVRTSEYVDAEDIRLTDVIPNGLCPAFPAQQTQPKLSVTTNGTTAPYTDAVEWSQIVTPGSACNYPNTETGANVSDATVESINFNASTGAFTVVFAVAEMTANDHAEVRYTLMQRPNYTGSKGSTSSGDRLTNRVSITGTTTSTADIEATPGLPAKVGAERYPLDDSSATISSNFSQLVKEVLDRGKTIANAQPANWSAAAQTPFSPGDRVWYRIQVPFAEGIDTRNPVLDDYLPEGVAFVGATYAYSGITGVADAETPVDRSAPGFPTAYIPEPTVSGSSLSWELGERRGDYRFMPLDSTVTVYLEGVVQQQSASADDVDSPANHAKYQQVNVDGDLTFLRDDATVTLDWGATLQKNVKSIGDGASRTFGQEGPAAGEIVRQGDAVTYRIDVTAPQNTTDEYVIWDVLPKGVRAADVSAFTAATYDGAAASSGTGETPLASGDFTTLATDSPAGSPQLSADYTGRSVIVWKISKDITGSTAAAGSTPGVTRGFTVGYTLTVPAGSADGGDAAQVTQSFENTASIVSYEIPNSGTGGATTVVPQREGGGQQLTDRAPDTDAGEIGFDDTDTFDSAEVHLPDASVTKKLVSTEIAGSGTTPTDANNGAGAIVQGEYATFEYAVTIPAKTTVANATLSDRGVLTNASGQNVDTHYRAGSARFFGPGNTGETADSCGNGTLAGFTCGDDARATLAFPASYTNATNADQTFRVQATYWVGQTNPGQLTNRATFATDNPNGGAQITHAANVTVDSVTPVLSVTKTSDATGPVAADALVTYKIVVGTGASSPKSYDNVVHDDVPEGLHVVAGSFRVNGDPVADDAVSVAAGALAGDGGRITWTHEQIPALAEVRPAVELTYQATIDPAAGAGQEYVNTAAVAGATLPAAIQPDEERSGDLSAQTTATIKADTAGVTKRVRSAGSTAFSESISAPVGTTAEYEVRVELKPKINYYSVRIDDSGLKSSQPITGAQVSIESGSTSTDDTANWSLQTTGADSRSWTYTANGGTIASNASARTLVLRYNVVVTKDMVASNAVANTANFRWKASTSQNAILQNLDDDANVSILRPTLGLTKGVRIAGTTGSYAASVNADVDQRLEYRVRATNANTASSSAAYNATFTDQLPAGIVLDASSFTLDGVAAPAGAVQVDGRTITWTIAGPLQPGATSTLGYQATLAAAAQLTASAQQNTARISEYFSYTTPEAERFTSTSQAQANVTPKFPKVALTKAAAASPANAYAGEPFEWVVTATNTGNGGAQRITLSDALPKNWEFDRVISVTGATAATQPSAGATGTIEWTFGADALSGAPAAVLAPGAKIEIHYTAIPKDPEAISDPGTARAHTNTVSASVTDRRGETRNQTATYAGDPKSADARIGEADLVLEKDAIGGVTESGAAQFDAEAGAWIPGASASTAYAQPQWRITVKNAGTSDGYGPFVISDTVTQPAGATTGAFTARYYSGGTDVVGTPLAVATDGAGKLTVGARSTFLKTGSADRIVLTANVDIAATATATADQLANTATVTGRTYENPSNLGNNTDDASRELTPVADLAIAKTVNSSTVVVGSPVTWGLTVRNNGPSVSAATTGAPITITDTVPEGVTGVTATSTSDWTVSLADGSPLPEGGVDPGTELTWTYTGATLPLGASSQVTLTGTILTAHTGELVNAATVHPGATPEPANATANNSAEVSVTPDDSTTLAVTKTRVVNDDGDWRPATESEPYVPGSPVSYLVRIANHGPADARNVHAVDQRPAGLTYASHEGLDETAWTDAHDSSTDTFTLNGTQAPGTTVGFVVTYNTASTSINGAQITNTVTAHADNSTNDPDASSVSDAERNADLSIAKSHVLADGATAAAAGSTFAYVLTVTNEGPSDASAEIDVVDELPVGLSYAGGAQLAFGGATTAFEPTVDGQTLSWRNLTSNADLPNSGTAIIIFSVTADPTLGAQSLVNTASVQSDDDTDPGNDVATDTVDIVREATMRIEKRAAAETGIAGGEMQYELTVTNDGPSAAPAMIADALPSGMSLVSISGDGWDCSASNAGSQSAQCEYTDANGLLAVGSPTVVTVTAAIAPTVLDGTELVNTATVTWSDNAGSHSDDDEAAVTVRAEADLGLEKVVIDGAGGEIVDPGTGVAGTSVWFRLQAHNYGASDAAGPVVVIDTLPLGLTVPASLTQAGEWQVSATEADPATPQIVTFTLASGLAADTAGDPDRGVAPVIEFEAQLASTLSGTITNTAVVASATAEPVDDPHSNEASADIALVRTAELGFEKSHVATESDAYRIGDEVTFVFDATNDGPSAVNGVTLTDTLPAGLNYVDGTLSGDGWAFDSATEHADGSTTVVASYTGTVLPGEAVPTARLTATVTVAIGTADELTNSAQVVPDTDDPRAAEDDDRVTVVPLADLQVRKSVENTILDEAVTAGKPLTWIIAPRNAGPSVSLNSSADPITLIDRLPAGIHGVADPSTELWTATVTRAGAPSTFPARAGDVVTWTLDPGVSEFPVGTDALADPTLTRFDIRIAGDIDAGWTSGDITNSVDIAAGKTVDPDQPNNVDQVTVAPGDDTSLRVDKTRVVRVDGAWVTAVDQDPVPVFQPGDDVSYRVTVVNDGPADARDVTVVDEVPEGLSYRSHESEGVSDWARTAGGTSSVGTRPDWDTFSLSGSQQVGADSARSFVVTYRTDPAMPNGDSFTNSVEATATNWVVGDGDPGRARDDDHIASTRSADLEITKTHVVPESGAAIAGETVTYELVVENHGPSVSSPSIDISDVLPEGLSYVADSSTISIDDSEPVPFAPVADGRGLIWVNTTADATLAPDAKIVVRFDALIDASYEQGASAVNTATVAGPDDHNPLNDIDTDAVDVAGSADLALTKRVQTSVDDISAGKTVTWIIEPRNLGPSISVSSDTTPITVTDTLPAGIRALASDPSNDLWRATLSNVGGWSAATAGDTVTWTYLGASILVGATPDIELTAVVDPAWVSGTITNTAAVDAGGTPDPNTENNQNGVQITSPGDATAISLAKHRVVQQNGVWIGATETDRVVPGTEVSYRFTALNEGPADARAVRVVDRVPAGLTYQSFVSETGEWSRTAGGADATGATNAAWDTFELSGTQQVGQEHARSFIVTYTTDPALDVTQPLVNTAEATAENAVDPAEAVDSSDQSASADLSIVKTSDQDRVNAGGTIAYRLLVSNEGPSISRGPIDIVDSLPTGLHYVPGSARVAVASGDVQSTEPRIEAVSGAERLTWTPVAGGASLAVDDTIAVDLQVRVDDTLFSAQGVTNVASVRSGDDANPANNVADATVVIDPVATLVVEKSAVGDFQVGGTGEYRITVENQGPTADPGPIAVIDQLPDGLRFASSPSDGVSVDGQRVAWTIEHGLQVGERAEFTLFVHVDQGAYPSVTNSVTVSSQITQTDGAQLTDDATVEVRAADGLATTGGNAAPLAALAALLLLVGGAGALMLARRRRDRAGTEGATA